MLGRFEYAKDRWSNLVEVRADDGTRFELNDTILVEVLGGTSSAKLILPSASVNGCALMLPAETHRHVSRTIPSSRC
jgi:hypothetical protein